MIGAMQIGETTPTDERLLELVGAMADRPVLVLADLVADKFVHGAPKRISREAPVLILRHDGEEIVPGGGANAVANVASLGGRPIPVGAVGVDDSGDALVEIFEERGIATGGILRRRELRTPTKVRIMAGGRHAIKQQIVRYDIEDRIDEPPSGTFEALVAAIESSAASAPEVAILSDYGYGSVSPALVETVRGVVGRDGIVLADSRYRLRDFAGIDGASPNEEEAESLLGRPLGEEAERIAESARSIRETLGLRFLFLTRGSAGMTMVADGRCAHLPIHGTDEVADVTGAGDTVIGTVALALAAGGTPIEAALLATYAGGVVVMKRGTATLSPDELRRAIESDPGLLEEISWASA